jgi:hypothetical protein
VIRGTKQKVHPMTTRDTSQDPIEIHADEKIRPFILAPHWLLLFPISPVARQLYLLLVAHINQGRGDTKVWPSKAHLAEMLSFTKPDTLDKYLNELYAACLVTVKRTKSDRGLRSRNTYTVRMSPPLPNYDISLSEWYQNKNKIPAQPVPPTTGLPSRLKQETPGQDVPPSTGVRTPVDGGYVPPSTGVELEELKQEEKTLSPLHTNSSAVDTKPPQERNFESNNTTPNPNNPIADNTRYIPTLPETDPAQTITNKLNWHPHPQPPPNERAKLHPPIRAALRAGWTQTQLIPHLNNTLTHATTNPIAYLIGALQPARLKNTTPPQPARDYTDPHRGTGNPTTDRKAQHALISSNQLPDTAKKERDQALKRIAARKRYANKHQPFIPADITTANA